MEKALIFKELAVVIAVEAQDARIVTPEFLAQTGVVQKDWEMLDKPLISERGTIIRYSNGYAIAANPKQIQMLQPFDGQPGGVNVPNMALRYCEILNTLSFRAVGINFRSLVEFPEPTTSPQEYILSIIDASRFNTKPTKANLNFSYDFDRSILNLAIQEGLVANSSNSAKVPSVIFSGNCESRLQPEDNHEVQGQIRESLNAWETEFAKYTTIVTDFLK